MILIKKLFVTTHLFLASLFCFVPHIPGQSLTSLSVNHPKEDIEIFVNQVAFDEASPKSAVIGAVKKLTEETSFSIVNVYTSQKVYTAKINKPDSVEDWFPGTYYYRVEFTQFSLSGKYRIEVSVNSHVFKSPDFSIVKNGLAMLTIPSVIHYFNKQRANTEPELQADAHLQVYGSNKLVDLHGGWCDASGDVSKYFSHLAYANFMSPQQIPLVTWSLAQTSEEIPHLLSSQGVADSIKDEAIWGADYMMRALSAENYFYMIVFSYFNKNPDARRVVGLLANSVTTSDYQCAFREGGGLAIAALARIAGWKRNGDFTSQQYLEGAERAFSHLLVNNTTYDDDGKENIIDDYCALLAATELWIATDSSLYRDEARKRALHLSQRLSSTGYFIANDTNRPFWHASDAGMPIVALARYVSKEKDPDRRSQALSTIKKALDYEMTVTYKVTNPFGYARQNFLFRGKAQEGFFIPHENETGWWWQGENARLSSLAAAALIGGRLVYPGKNTWGVTDSIAYFAMNQLSWILGCNPYAICFMYQFGKNNVPAMSSNFGHGSQKGGISNGITGKEGNDDGSGIDYKINAAGNEWRWTEQWLPHAAWYLLAVSAMAEPCEPFVKPTVSKFKALVMTEPGGIHKPFVDTARIWLQKLANDSNFTIDYIENTDKINEVFLSQYQVFIQLNYPPYHWNDTAKLAFEKYMKEGKGLGWVGFHHATLLGEFDGYRMWPWFSDFMGGIRFENYIADFATGTITVEDSLHPCMQGLPSNFVVDKEEWYTYNKSPRPNVHVLAHVNESSYVPDTQIKMGDHPVVWTNEHMKARNIYIFMGHHPGLFQNSYYTTLVRNAIFWAAGR